MPAFGHFTPMGFITSGEEILEKKGRNSSVLTERINTLSV